MTAPERRYFTAEPTSLTISRSGALAIFAGDTPRKNEDGSTSYSLRAPFLLMPQELWEDADEVMSKVAQALNDSAHLFFDSARATPAATDPKVTALVEAATSLVSTIGDDPDLMGKEQIVSMLNDTAAAIRSVRAALAALREGGDPHEPRQ